LSGSAKSRNGEQFEKANKHIAGLCKSILFQKEILIDKLGMDEIEISSSLKWTIAKSKQRLIRLSNLMLLQKPSRRFGTKPDAEDKGYCWNKRGAQL
jgi:hypothetical protein